MLKEFVESECDRIVINNEVKSLMSRHDISYNMNTI